MFTDYHPMPGTLWRLSRPRKILHDGALLQALWNQGQL
jgi:hypothetical protein